MFDHLVESQSNTEDLKRKGGFLGMFTLAYALLLSFVLIGSVVWYDAHLDSQNLELETLVAPVPIPETKVEEQKQEEKPQKTEQDVDVREKIVARVDEPQVAPDKVSNDAEKIPPRRENRTTVIGKGNSDATTPEVGGPVGPSGGGGGTTPQKPVVVDDDDAPPAPKPTPKPPPKTISGGVLNGKAISLPRPQYPQIARAAKASGTVVVQVTIDESGKVVSASAVSGHPLLKAAAVQAAYGARFSPTMLSGQAVKVTGQINYNFLPQ